jgi:transcriptional regulator with XRE-family HTH domain
MDMKLDSQKIRELRHRKSWSQEKLAELAGLNPRTIQRVEADGTASLQTRLRLATVFGVQPQLLDAEQAGKIGDAARPGRVAAIQAYVDKLAANTSLPLLLLVSVIFLACTVPYFTLSRTSFLWFNYGVFEAVVPGWYSLLILILPVFWVLLAMPWILFLRRSRPHLLKRYFILLSAAEASIYLRYWQPELAMQIVTISLYISSLLLLLSFFITKVDRQGFWEVSCASLLTYIVLGGLHDRVGLFVLGSLARWQRDLPFAAPWISFGDYVMRILESMTQLVPVLLVLLLALGADRRQQGSGSDGPLTARRQVSRVGEGSDLPPTAMRHMYS